MHSVLLIDDDHEMSAMLTELFKRESVELTVVDDGVKGLDAALNGDFELILLDVMLPGIDGMQLLQRLRQQHRNTAVLMLTARGDDDDRVMGLELGADDYLPSHLIRVNLLHGFARCCAEHLTPPCNRRS